VRTKAERFVADGDADLFDLVFVDPPYAMATQQVAALVEAVAESFAADDALFVVERATRDPFAWPEGVEGLRDKKYGETRLWYGRAAVRSLT
jgi:16S rRNA (guanine966-N2)-methyltransferase